MEYLKKKKYYNTVYDIKYYFYSKFYKIFGRFLVGYKFWRFLFFHIFQRFLLQTLLFNLSSKYAYFLFLLIWLWLLRVYAMNPFSLLLFLWLFLLIITIIFTKGTLLAIDTGRILSLKLFISSNRGKVRTVIAASCFATVIADIFGHVVVLFSLNFSGHGQIGHHAGLFVSGIWWWILLEKLLLLLL